MWSRLLRPDLKRQRLLRKTAPGPLQEFYQQAFTPAATAVRDVQFAVLDFETTGLDLKQDHIISMGLVEIDKLSIPLSSAWHQIVRSTMDMPGETAIIHKITDDMIIDGMDLDEAFNILLQRLSGRVLIAHHAGIELGFINQFCQKRFAQDFYMPTIDTQLLAQRVLARQLETLQSGALRLFNLRKKYGFPAYRAHNALSDALATAELFLALLNDLYPRRDCRLRDLLSG
jgi:DNA polymerase-3 subunit epsilon